MTACPTTPSLPAEELLDPGTGYETGSDTDVSDSDTDAPRNCDGFPCLHVDCSKTFPSDRVRRRHMDEHYTYRFFCPRCGVPDWTYHNVKMHRRLPGPCHAELGDSEYEVQQHYLWQDMRPFWLVYVENLRVPDEDDPIRELFRRQGSREAKEKFGL